MLKKTNNKLCPINIRLDHSLSLRLLKIRSECMNKKWGARINIITLIYVSGVNKRHRLMMTKKRKRGGL